MGCGERRPSTHYIAVTLTSRATRRYAGSREYVHHSLSDFAILGVRFSMHNKTRIINKKLNLYSYVAIKAASLHTHNNTIVATSNLTTASHKSCKTVPLGTQGTPWSCPEDFVLLRRFLLLFIPKNKITAERKLRFLSKTGVRNGKYRNPEDSGRNMQPRSGGIRFSVLFKILCSLRIYSSKIGL